MERIRTYAEFWPFYLQEHSKLWTVRLHALGTFAGLATVGTLLGLGYGAWALLGVLVGYAFAWPAHFFVEKNRPATFKYPWWSFISDFRMLWWYLTGRLTLQR